MRDELAVLSQLAQRLGAPVAFCADPSEVFDELARIIVRALGAKDLDP